MENHIIIKAYGYITRSWQLDEHGYRCSECCNGDRCDEDCIARYKGRRKECTHCKGKGSIPKEDAVEISLRQLIDMATTFGRINT